MMTYKKGDVVVVPFPFADSSKAKPRPAVVLSSGLFSSKTNHSLLAMITTAANTAWYNDIKITELNYAGLSAESVVRFKLFSLDNRIIMRKIGLLSTKDKANLSKAFLKII